MKYSLQVRKLRKMLQKRLLTLVSYNQSKQQRTQYRLVLLAKKTKLDYKALKPIN